MDESTRNTNNRILEADLCYEIQGAIYKVANKYGRGLKEKIYQKALAEELEKRKLKFEEQKRINIYSLDSGKILGTYIPDFIIEDKIIIEIKATSFTTRTDIDQQRSYLRTSTYEIGYLVNFSTPELDMRRSIYTNDRKSFIALLHKDS